MTRPFNRWRGALASIHRGNADPCCSKICVSCPAVEIYPVLEFAAVRGKEVVCSKMPNQNISSKKNKTREGQRKGVARRRAIQSEKDLTSMLSLGEQI